MPDPLELVFQAAMSCPTQVLGTVLSPLEECSEPRGHLSNPGLDLLLSFGYWDLGVSHDDHPS